MAFNRSQSDDFFNSVLNFVPTNSSTGAHSTDTSPSTPQYPPYTPPSFVPPYYPAYQNDPNFQQWQQYQQWLLSQQARMTSPSQPILETPQPVPPPIPQPETQPEAAPEGSTRRKNAKGKKVVDEKVIKKPKVAWSGEEEKHLALCWLDVSEDPIVGTSQTGDHFWNKVFDMYNAKVQIKRRPDQITGKWRLIKEQVGKFNSIYKKYDLDRRSGENDAQVMEQVRQAYTLETGGKFTMYEAWTVLKDRPKFLSFIGVDGMVIKKKRISRNIESSDEDQPPINLDEEEQLDTDLFGPDAIPRPATKSKKKTPRTSESSDAASSRSSASDLAARLEQLGSSKQAFIDKKSDTLDSIREEEKKRTMYATFSFVGQSNPNPRQRKFIEKAMAKVVDEYKGFVEVSDDEDEGNDE